jgi:uncharacterized protein
MGSSVSAESFVLNRVLKFQVGFLLVEGKGAQATFELDIPRLRIADDVTVGYLKGAIRLSRTSRGVLVQGELLASIAASCHRCLDDVDYQLTLELEELFVHPPEADAEFVLPETGVLDLAPLLREEVILASPMHILCKEDCAGLCPQCGANLNHEPCQCQDAAVDPRLSALRMLRDRLNQEHES